MRIGAIVLKLRWEQTSFKNFVGGATEFNLALHQGNVLKDSLFVIPGKEDAEKSEYDSGINQKITENFSVVVCLKNDKNQTDKLGMIPYERLHEKRNEIFKALIGWEIPISEGMIYYAGGDLLQIDPSYLWYRYDFAYDVRLENDSIVTRETGDHTETIFDLAKAISNAEAGELNEGKYAGKTYQEIIDLIPDPEDPATFQTIYMNLIQSPSRDLPHTGDLPLPDGYPDVSLPNMANWIDMTKHPDDGAFFKSYGNGFKTFKG